MSYHFIVFRRHVEDTSQLGIHEIIGFCLFPLVEMKNGHVIHQVKLRAAGISLFAHILVGLHSLQKQHSLSSYCK